MTACVVLYHAPECGSCAAVATMLEELAAAGWLELVSIEISGDPALEARHRAELPVVEIDGVVAFTQAVDRRSMLHRLRQAAQTEPPRATRA